MSTPSKSAERRSNGKKKKRTSDGNGNYYGDHALATNGDSETHRKLAQRIIHLASQGGSQDMLLDKITNLVEENTVKEVEKMRGELQTMKEMLHQATNLLQDTENEIQSPRKTPPSPLKESRSSHSSSETHAIIRKLQEEHKKETDEIRQYFEAQCEKNQRDYSHDILKFKSEAETLKQQLIKEAENVNVTGVRQLQEDNERIMREKAQVEQANSQLQLTLMKMEHDKLAAEERTKKILTAVREGLHRLSDMKEDRPADSSPGLNNFYSHVEEIITTDDWGDDEMNVKGVMEEIQVSVQKLARPSKLARRVSVDVQTENPVDIETVKAEYESRIATMQESFALERRRFQQSQEDSVHKITKLSQKVEADKRFIDEMTSEREAEREELLKVTSQLEKAWTDNDRLMEKLNQMQLAREDLESQLRQMTVKMDETERMYEQVLHDSQEKDDRLKQRDEIIADLENHLAKKNETEIDYQNRLEGLKLELSGFLRSPATSPEPPLEASFSFDDLFKQIMDLKDELERRYTSAEKERATQLVTLQEELDRCKRHDNESRFARQQLAEENERKDMEIAELRQELDSFRFGQVSEEELLILNNELDRTKQELQSCQRLVREHEQRLSEYSAEVNGLRSSVDNWRSNYEQLREQSLGVRDELLARLEELELQNANLLAKIEEAGSVLEQQQRAWDEELSQKNALIDDYQEQLRETKDFSDELHLLKVDFDELRKRLEQSETSLRDRTLQLQNCKSLLEVMRTESAQKDAVIKSVQKQSNETAMNLTEQLRRSQELNMSLSQEIDQMRDASSRFIPVQSLDLTETDSKMPDVFKETFQTSSSQNESALPKTVCESSVQTDLDVSVPLQSADNEAAAAKSMLADDRTEIKHDDVTTDSDGLSTALADCKATIRELQNSIAQKDSQLAAMSVELASLSERHGRTQSKHRATIRHLQTSSSSGDETPTRSAPRSTASTGDSKKLISKYEQKLKEKDEQHAEELQRLVKESVTVVQQQTANMTLSMEPSSGDVTNRDMSWLNESVNGSSLMNTSMDSTLVESGMSDSFVRAMKDLRAGCRAVIKAAMQNTMNTSINRPGGENWTAERDLLLAKIDCLRETVNQLTLSRDSLESTVRSLEQQNEELVAELNMLKAEDQMADEGKDLLLSLLKKTEAELAELQARYRQRDLRLEIEQAGREREEREREKLQKELRDTEVQLVRVRGELRQKEAQWERERILTMWKRETNRMEFDELEGKSTWKGKYLRAESYRKNLVHQKQYLITLMQDVILNSNDDFVKMLALDGIRPTATRSPGAREWRPMSFRTVAVLVRATVRLRFTKDNWAQRKALV